MSWWSERMLDWAMSRPPFKTQLFRFVDVFPALDRDDLGSVPRVNVSIKPTALAAHYDPLGRELGVEQAKTRVRPLLRLAHERGAFVHFDMEHYNAKNLTLQLFRDLLSEPEFADLEPGIVV